MPNRRLEPVEVLHRTAMSLDRLLYRWVRQGVPVVDRNGLPVLDEAGSPVLRPPEASELSVIIRRLRDCNIAVADRSPLSSLDPQAQDENDTDDFAERVKQLERECLAKLPPTSWDIEQARNANASA